MVRMLIGGELVEGSRTLDVVDPCTGVAFTQVPDAVSADLERAVAAAKAAFPAWRDLAPVARGDVLRAMAAKVADNAEELCALLVQETGRPMALAQFEILHLATGYLTYYAGLDVQPELIVEDDTRRVELHRKPLGVVGAIRSEEHTSELQSLMRISYAVFCLKQKTQTHNQA